MNMVVVILMLVAGAFTLTSVFSECDEASMQRMAIIILLLAILVCLYEVTFIS